ncbi:MAG: CoA-binding protein [Myxococcaceae bacterium]|nr:CoA-binding protein [Myxococcaceae bacterium]
MGHPNIIETEAELEAIVRAAKTVAVVGMKDERTPYLPSYEIPRAVESHGLRVIPVNPHIEKSLGKKAFSSLAAMGERVDIVDVFRRIDAIAQLADDVLALPQAQRPKVVWLQSGIRHDAAAQRLAEAGIQVVQDRCLGVYTSRYR